MFNFFPIMDDSTPVHYYMASLILYEGKWIGGKDLIQVTTWGKLKKHWPKKTSIPKNVFGPSEPMYVLEFFFDNRSTLLVKTKTQIGEPLDGLPKMSAEEQRQMIGSIQELERLGPEIIAMEANLSLLSAQIEAMEKMRVALQAASSTKK